MRAHPSHPSSLRACSIVESMNEFFSSVFTSEDCDNFPEFEYVTNSKLSDILCDTKEVEKLLKKLNIYKSPGPDSLPPRILKECASVLSSPLCYFFNKSFSTVACEQAPSKGGKKFGERASGSQSVVTPRAKRVGRALPPHQTALGSSRLP